jgi:PBP1b-binding outer membrane lipoprotein LpoB
MKKIIAIAFASAIALAGCNSVTTSSVTPAVVTTVADVQAIVTSVCGFVPAASTIASIISANPAVATGSQIANIICQAVTKKSAHRGVAAPTVVVNGQVIEVKGHFVK